MNANQPVQTPSMPAQAPSITPPMMPPKRKKTGLIIGIVAGSLALIALIAGLLIYFLWYQSPQKTVTDAVSNLITAKHIVTNGNIVVDMGRDGMFELEIKGASNESKGKADFHAKFTTKDGLSRGMTVKGAIIMDKGGDIYIKLDNVKDVVMAGVRTALSWQARQPGMSLEARAQNEAALRSVMAQLDVHLNKLQNKWLKVSAEDMAAGSKQSQCQFGLIGKMNENSKLRTEISTIYQKHDFLMVKNGTVEPRNGGKGFDVTIDERKVKAFAEGMKTTQFAKELEACMPSRSKDSPNITKHSEATSVKIWADGSHNLKAFELEAKDQNSRARMKASFELDTMKREDIEIPADAESLKSVMQGIMSSFSRSL